MTLEWQTDKAWKQLHAQRVKELWIGFAKANGLIYCYLGLAAQMLSPFELLYKLYNPLYHYWRFRNYQ
jgi:hypothetical protein